MTDDVFDLDDVAAETRGHPWRMRFGGEVFDMPALSGRAFLAVGSLMGDFAGGREAAAMGRLADVLSSLFASPADWDRFLDAGAEPGDFMALLAAVTERSGSDLGKASASPTSSADDGRPSKPTLRATTG